MDAESIIGFVLTGVAMAAFVSWTWHELRRVDQFTDRRERRD